MLQQSITIATSGQRLYEFTDQVREFVSQTGTKEGLLTVYVRHTSCSLIVQENADPDVQRDLLGFFNRLVPPASDPSMAWLTHTMEGPDDMPAHIKTALNQTSIAIPVANGTPLFGTWQGIYLFEHRDNPHQRSVVLHLSA